MGFGFASLLTSPISYFLITKYDVINTFYLLGVAYFLVMLIVSQFLKFPYYSEQDTNDSHKQLSQGIGAKKALKTVEFYLLWLILFINTSCGLALILSLIHIFIFIKMEIVQALRQDIIDCRTFIQTSRRVLENHLNTTDKVVFLRVR